jgi:uroporphyrinogen III methyltransferase/synthase
MGMENLSHIIQQLIKHGRSPDTPIALIRWGTRPEQQVVVGTLADITERAQEANLTSPVVIVVGEVVKMREKLQWIEKRPLFGRRIAVTRARAQASALTLSLESLGAEVWEFPTIDIVPPADYSPLDECLTRINTYQWIIFTSVNGVEAFFQRLWEKGGDVRQLLGIRLAAIGPATGKALEKRGLRVDYIPEVFRAEAIADGLAGRIKPGDRVLLPRAREARVILVEMLQKMGAAVEEVVTYETVMGSADSGILLDLLQNRQLDAVTFTSASTVRNFLNLINTKKADVASLMDKIVVACIGPITADTARELGLSVQIVANEYTIAGLVEALTAYYIKEKPGMEKQEGGHQ